MDLPLVAIASSVLSSALSAMKFVREVSDGSDDLELKSKINDLYTALLDLRASVLDLAEENRTLRVALVEKSKYVGPIAPHGYYFVDGDKERPLCPRCFQETPQRIAFLTSPHEWNGGIRRTCKLCRHHVYEKEMES